MARVGFMQMGLCPASLSTRARLNAHCKMVVFTSLKSQYSNCGAVNYSAGENDHSAVGIANLAH